MKLKNIMESTLSDLLQQCNVVEIKPHALDDGTIASIEVKYVPDDYMAVENKKIGIKSYI